MCVFISLCMAVCFSECEYAWIFVSVILYVCERKSQRARLWVCVGGCVCVCVCVWVCVCVGVSLVDGVCARLCVNPTEWHTQASNKAPTELEPDQEPSTRSTQTSAHTHT